MQDRKLSSTSFTFSEREMPVKMGKYHLLSRLSCDPIGEEFVAAWGVEEGLEQLRVIRCIYPRVAQEAEFIGLFSEEARALSQLGSANIARIMEVNIDGEIPYVAREYVEGLSLARLLELSREQSVFWPWDLATFVVAELLRGLDYVHRREDIHGNPMGMRHGDVRPENVMLSFSGEVKLINFGSMLGFIVDEATHARLDKIRSRFYPPENQDGYESTVAGDLWAAALILVSLMGNRVPDTTRQGWRPQMLKMKVADLPDVMDSFIARALNPQAEYRFRTAAAMRSALVEVLGTYSRGHGPDDLVAFIKQLGQQDHQIQKTVIRNMVGREASMSLGNTTGTASSLGPGYVLDDRYHLLRNLGEGGMGTVFEAEHLGLHRKVAVKVLHDRVMSDTATVERFKREARIIASIGHPHIVSAQDFGVDENGHYYMSMEMLEGEALSTHIQAKQLTYRELAETMASVCDGLQAAHDAGIIHRDLKPDNIIITDKGPRILDFGIAKSIGLESENDALTKTGHICGTVDYIAPEQIRGGLNDPRSDIYAVGVILYEALTGDTPFHGRTVGEALHKAINDKLVPPGKRSGKTDIPPQLEAVCIKALNKKVEKRWASAADMAQALRSLAARLSHEKTMGDAIVDTEMSQMLRYSKPWGMGLSLVLLVMLTGGGWWYWQSTRVVPPEASVVTDGTGDRSSGDASSVNSEPNRARDASLVEVLPHPTEETATATASKRESTDGDTKGQVSTNEVSGEEKGAAVANGTHRNTAEVPQEVSRRQEESLEISNIQTKRGDELLRVRQYKPAIDAFELAVKHNHRNEAAWFGMGKAYFSTGNYARSIEALEQAIRYAPVTERLPVRNVLGAVYLSAGHKEKAVGQWKKVLSISPDNEKAKRYLSKVADDDD